MGERRMTYEMSERLTRENLHGVWTAIATPFDEDNRFDEGIFRENVRRLHAAGVHGVYTTDSDGEFYAIELDEFKQIVRVFADEAQRLNLPTMVGVTWCNTQGMIDRLQYAACIHGLPTSTPVTCLTGMTTWQTNAGSRPDIVRYGCTPLGEQWRFLRARATCMASSAKP